MKYRHLYRFFLRTKNLSSGNFSVLDPSIIRKIVWKEMELSLHLPPVMENSIFFAIQKFDLREDHMQWIRLKFQMLTHSLWQPWFSLCTIFLLLVNRMKPFLSIQVQVFKVTTQVIGNYCQTFLFLYQAPCPVSIIEKFLLFTKHSSFKSAPDPQRIHLILIYNALLIVYFYFSILRIGNIQTHRGERSNIT